MKPSDVIRLLTAVLPTREPVYIEGPPGLGKSACVHQSAELVAQQINDKYGVVEIRGSQIEVSDLYGLPFNDGGKTGWLRPLLLPTEGRGIVFLDEMPQSSAEVLKAFMQLVNERRVGPHKLGDGYTIIAAGNRITDRSAAGRIPAALHNRFATHIEVEVSTQDWLTWAVANGVAPEIRSYIQMFPGALFEFDPATETRSFPTPRGWHKLSNILRATPPDLLQRVAAGNVGEARAAEFCAHMEFYKQLPDVDADLANPTACKIPTEPSVLFIVIAAMGDRAKANHKLIPNFTKWSLRLPNEFSAVAMRDAIALAKVHNKAVIADPAVIKWVKTARENGWLEA